jgi:hypothetical protein
LLIDTYTSPRSQRRGGEGGGGGDAGRRGEGRERCRDSADSHDRLQAPPVVGLFCFYSRSLLLADSHGRLEYH